MSFRDVMAGNPSRLVITYQRNGVTGDQYNWGPVGTIPMMGLVGFITKVQVDLASGPLENRECPESALVIVWDGKAFDWWVHPDIPVDPLLGMLETIKSSLVADMLMQQAQQRQRGIIKPPGGIIPGR